MNKLLQTFNCSVAIRDCTMFNHLFCSQGLSSLSFCFPPVDVRVLCGSSSSSMLAKLKKLLLKECRKTSRECERETGILRMEEMRGRFNSVAANTSLLLSLYVLGWVGYHGDVKRTSLPYVCMRVWGRLIWHYSSSENSGLTQLIHISNQRHSESHTRTHTHSFNLSLLIELCFFFDTLLPETVKMEKKTNSTHTHTHFFLLCLVGMGLNIVLKHLS